MNIGCVILAGGKSSRMGEDKALLDYNGKNFIEKIADEMSSFTEKIIARGNNSDFTSLTKESWRIISDIYPDHGPIGGLHAALKGCESDALFCVSCDIPLITEELARKICDEMTLDMDAIIAVTADGKSHPLCGVYRKKLCQRMGEQILQDNNRMMELLKKCHVKYMHLDEETSKQLANINTRSEYENLSRE